jgi:CheY-like chemotaxis protein
VEDVPEDAFFFEAALRECAPDVELIHAIDGKSALEILKQRVGRLPDLIVTDLNMPGVNGFDLLMKLKADATFAGLSVIVFSSSNLDSDRQAAIALGAKGFQTKPLGQAALMKEVSLICKWLGEKLITQPMSQNDSTSLSGNPKLGPEAK